jgi:hypothetical protein
MILRPPTMMKCPEAGDDDGLVNPTSAERKVSGLWMARGVTVVGVIGSVSVIGKDP